MNAPATPFARHAPKLADLRNTLRLATHRDEAEAVAALLESCSLTSGARHRIVRRARDLVEAARARRDRQGGLDAFLQEFGLSNREGVALMCLAEALLRVPDTDTADKLIAEKIKSGAWADHRGRSDSLFVNASTWALMLTGRVIDLDRDTREDLGGWFSRLVGRAGEPVIRSAVNQAMRIMGGQFVLGRTIEEAMDRARKANPKGVFNSFDMLGEGARTAAAAGRYFNEYLGAIRAIGKLTKGETVYDRHGISVKLSALHPRYEFKEAAIVMADLLPRLRDLALAAKEENLGFNIDAEEARRLDLSLDLFEALARDPDLAGWDGLGFVVQAYQKRAPHVIDWLAALGRETGRRFMVRLVKGAYWDSEIKHAQERGLVDYPVYTRKASTDLSYLVCAGRMLDASDTLYAQFATHNAHSVAAILEMTQSDTHQGVQDFEFQRLHGMGELLYDGVRKMAPAVRVRFIPVGQYKDLLPYLVRRLLENGANSSFVNRFMDDRTPVEDLVKDPVTVVEGAPPRHANIPVPRHIYRASGLPRTDRDNARGIDLDDPNSVAPLLETMEKARARDYLAVPVINGQDQSPQDAVPVSSPADRSMIVGWVRNAIEDEVSRAAEMAADAQRNWDHLGGAARADILARAADVMEAETENLMALITAEAGRTIDDALDEVREAVDFLRYYAEGARADFAEAESLPGPTGEANSISLHGRGVFACISPWNFPLAIFTGQVAAALAAGNSVLAKPAEQTPLIGREAVRILHEAGVPGNVLHFLPGDGRVGAAMASDQCVTGVAFTGSTETAQIINRTLAGRDGPIPTLIAETGGQNAMIVDSTALAEQVVDDAVVSAFRSAGQRCSALRVLFLQEDIADGMIEMLSGAMDALVMGDPARLETDVGPVIDDAAQQMLDAHVKRMMGEARLIKACSLPEGASKGSFVAPHMVEIESLDVLEREVFGPILHVMRYKVGDLPCVLESIKRTRYGLTLGVHSRIKATAEEIFETLNVGNIYVNRNMVGAIVGVQPFGGQGLSGTGPKAGGPRYLYRFATEKTLSINTTATGGNAALFCLTED